MVTDGNGNDNHVKSNVSLDALAGLGNPNPNPTPTGDPNGGTTPPNNGTPAGDPNGTPAGTGTPPTGDPNGGTGTPPVNTPPVVDAIPENVDELLPLLSDVSNTNPELVKYRQLLLTTFKGNTLDASGNVLNEQGEVVLTTETLKKYLTTGELPTNEKGEIVNVKGEVIGKASPPVSVVQTFKEGLKTQLGIDLPNVEVPDTEEGLFKLTQEAIKVRSIQAINGFLEAHPDVKGLYQHIKLGGKVEDYKSAHVDYSSINIKTLEETSKVDLLNKMFTLQGVPNKDNMINLIKSAGEEELNKAVAGAVLYLDGKQKQEAADRETQLVAQAKREQDETIKYWTTVEGVVKEGKVGDIVIPLADRDAFFAYMSKPVTEDMYSANDVDAEKDSLDFQLLVSYLRYKKGDISTLASIISKQNHVEGLRAKFEKLAHITGNGSVPITGNNVNNGKALTLDELLGGKK